MSAHDTIRMLLAGLVTPDPAEWKRKAARVAWVKETTAAWLAAQHEMDDCLGEAVDRLSEEQFERLCDAEQAKVDAIMAQLRAAADKDEWPRGLYWGGV